VGGLCHGSMYSERRKENVYLRSLVDELLRADKLGCLSLCSGVNISVAGNRSDGATVTAEVS
jgi:hypothetical protein